ISYCDDASTLEQWSGYLRMMHSMKGRSARHLVYAAASPPAEVLTQIAGAARGQPWTVALLSPSTAVRFAASTFAMIVRGFRFFPPDRMREALLHLQCDEAEQAEARRALARCRGIEASIPPK
ncbi:MAG TPA: hypothetical protein VMF89_20965, partial [Polyangiales bacterium]|nr:hypothetical protein [Polyangiales bacterium]